MLRGLRRCAIQKGVGYGIIILFEEAGTGNLFIEECTYMCVYKAVSW